MSSIEVKKMLRKKLLELPHAKPSGKSIIEFCPFCLKDTDHGHFYITIDENSDMPILYHCFRCEMAGILNGEVLRSLGIRDLKLSSSLLTYNKRSASYNKSKGVKSNEIHMKIPESKELYEWKKSYIENRLGIQLSFKEMEELKTVFSLGDLLNTNKVNRINCKKETALTLHKDYVGFLTCKNEFVIFRDCTNRNEKRYFKYPIFNDLDNTKKFYTIPNEIDIMTEDNINIVLAEGVFDILGIYHHVFNKKKKNMIYTAVCGCGYELVIKYFIQLGLVGDNICLHIFSDTDKSRYFYEKMFSKSKLKEWLGSVTLYYNSAPGEKDFGVSKDKITLVMKKI